MKLSRLDHEILEQIDDLLVSENEGVRELLQQALVIHTLSKDPDAKLRDKVYGPFTKMLNSMQQMEDRMRQMEHAINTLETQLRHSNYRNTGGYWTDNTTGAGQPFVTDTASGAQWYQGLSGAVGTAPTSLVDQEYMNKLKTWATTIASVKATTASDPDAMTLIDPDTGHKMHVK